MSLVVNFLGGPCTCKSAIAAHVFSLLKWNMITCELIPEFPKQKVWEESFKVLENQIYIFGKQHHYISRVLNKVDVILVDSPLILSLYYSENYNNSSLTTYFKELILYEFNKMKTLNILLDRDVPYDKTGRYQTEEEAIESDKKIRKMLDDNNIKYLNFFGNRNAVDLIYQFILNELRRNEKKENQII